jgi:hypothetical protein
MGVGPKRSRLWQRVKSAALSRVVFHCGAARYRLTGKAAYSIPSYSNSSRTFLPTPGKGRRLGRPRIRSDPGPRCSGTCGGRLRLLVALKVASCDGVKLRSRWHRSASGQRWRHGWSWCSRVVAQLQDCHVKTFAWYPRPEGLDPNDPAVVAALALVRL